MKRPKQPEKRSSLWQFRWMHTMVRCPNNIRLLHLMHNLLSPCPVCRDWDHPPRNQGRGSLTSSKLINGGGCINSLSPCPLITATSGIAPQQIIHVTHGVLKYSVLAVRKHAPTVTTPDWHNLPINFPRKIFGFVAGDGNNKLNALLLSPNGLAIRQQALFKSACCFRSHHLPRNRALTK